jgi:hypothetical protein
VSCGVTLLSLLECDLCARTGSHADHCRPLAGMTRDVASGPGGHMLDRTPQGEGTFGQLLEAMPRIAEAVNAFTSEKNQRAALDALVRAIGLADQPSMPPMPPAEPSLSVVRPPVAADEAVDGAPRWRGRGGPGHAARRTSAPGAAACGQEVLAARQGRQLPSSRQAVAARIRGDERSQRPSTRRTSCLFTTSRSALESTRSRWAMCLRPTTSAGGSPRPSRITLSW